MTRIKLLIFPLRNASRCPWRARSFELLLELVQIDFDQLPQLAQHALEVLRRGVVLRDLCLSRTRDRHALRADNVTDTIVDRWRRVDVALTRGGVTVQRAQNFVIASFQSRRLIL